MAVGGGDGEWSDGGKAEIEKVESRKWRTEDEERRKWGDWKMTNAVRLWRGQKAEIGGQKAEDGTKSGKTGLRAVPF
jgi:hypothetical protein